MQGDQEKELDELEDAVGEEDEDEVDASDPDDELDEKKAEVEEVECGLRFVHEDVKVAETLQQYKSILTRELKLDDFNPLQAEAIYVTHHLKRDCVLAIATGQGKSLISMMVHLLSRGVNKATGKGKIVVVVPLKALCEDQMRKLLEKFPGLRVLTFQGEVDGQTRQKIRDGNFDFGTHTQILTVTQMHSVVSVVFCAPEAITMEFRRLLEDLASRGDLALIVFDEAHTICLWGRAFRTAYTACSILKESPGLSAVPFLVL